MIRMLIAAAALALAVPAAPAAEMTFYQLPEGAYPHDVAPAPDGTVWFTGQRQGFMGRFDPRTGKLEKIPLGAGAAPHGVVVGPDGAAWVTEGGQNAIARVDADTQEVKLFRLPKEFPYASLNTPTIGNNGIVWFTGQRRLWSRRPEERQGRCLGVAEGPRALRHHHDAFRRHLVCIARRRPHRQGRHHDRRGDGGRAVQIRGRAAPHLVGFQGRAVGELLERRRDRAL
jgi:hypothetical protein